MPPKPYCILSKVFIVDYESDILVSQVHLRGRYQIFQIRFWQVIFKHDGVADISESPHSLNSGVSLRTPESKDVS